AGPASSTTNTASPWSEQLLAVFGTATTGSSCPASTVTSANMPGRSRCSRLSMTACTSKLCDVGSTFTDTAPSSPANACPGYADTATSTSCPGATSSTNSSGSVKSTCSSSSDCSVTM